MLLAVYSHACCLAHSASHLVFLSAYASSLAWGQTGSWV
jgi:hypothetical protein